jgi:hypothetical protein
MFKRLNNGGEVLTDQQLRNCTIRLLNPRFNDFVIALSRDEAFKATTEPLTEESRLGAFDQELVLRFFAMKNYRAAFKHDVGDFLTEYMEGVSDPKKAFPFDFAVEQTNFERTFKILSAALGELAFTYAKKARDELTRGFSVYHFEAISLGIQSRVPMIDPGDAKQVEKLRNVLKSIKLDPEFIRITTGGGKNSPGPLAARIAFVQTRMEQQL